MKKSILIILGFVTFSQTLFTQGLDNVLIEKYYVVDSVDASRDTNLIEGAVTYRIFIDMAEDFSYGGMFANSTHELYIQTASTFYNNPYGGLSGREIDISMLDTMPALWLDSYITNSNTSNSYHHGVLKQSDTDGSIIDSLNNDTLAIPLSVSDGNIPGINVGMRLTNIDSSAFFFPGDSLFKLDSGSWAPSFYMLGRYPENLVLIAQVTTDSTFSFELNVTLKNNNTNEFIDFVAKNPSGEEILSPYLTFPNVIGGCTNPIACNFDPRATFEDGSCVEEIDSCITCGFNYSWSLVDSDGDSVCDLNEIPGCTSITACNYDSLATDDDGSCVEPILNCMICSGDSLILQDTDGDSICDANEIHGCTSITACNYDSIATDDDGSCLEPVDSCLICNVTKDSLLLVDTDGDSVCDADEIPGCMSPTACNYDSLVTDEDGSCLEPVDSCLICNVTNDSLIFVDTDGDSVCDADEIPGCTSPTACNYDSLATDEDGSCLEPVDSCLICNATNDSLIFVDTDGDSICDADEIPGCMSPTACNYDSLATDEDGSCLEPVTNCLICNITNDSLLLVDTDSDGICDADEILGCTIFEACNYDSTATDDDGSCIVPIENCMICNENNDGLILIDTDNDGICDANEDRYIINNFGQVCDNDFIRVPVETKKHIENVIGYDISVKYNSEKLKPTGRILIKDDLIFSHYIDYTIDTLANDSMFISLSLNGTPPQNTFFQGEGTLFDIEFIKGQAFNYGIDSTYVFAPYMLEKYFDINKPTNIDSALIYTFRDSICEAAVKHWSNRPLAYDTNHPSRYLRTNIFSSVMCNDSVNDVDVFPNMAGEFRYHIKNGIEFEISRDIKSSTDVMPVINGYDALLVQKVLVNDSSFKANKYQLIAMDVNMDGKISAGDLSQINQRTVQMIDEFKQEWNYYTNKPSKDWLFYDKDNLDSITTITKKDIPSSPFCYQVGLDDECIIPFKIYQGIMLGDIDSSFHFLSADGILKNKRLRKGTKRKRVYVANTWTNSNVKLLNVPLYFESNTPVFSMDVHLNYNTEVLEFTNIVENSGQINYLYNEINEGDVKLTSYAGNLKDYRTTNAALVVNFLVRENIETDVEVISLPYAVLNGEPVMTEIMESFVSNSEEEIEPIRVYPNPANRMLKIDSNYDVIIQILDITGKKEFKKLNLRPQHSQSIDVSNYANGVYIIKTFYKNNYYFNKLIISNSY